MASVFHIETRRVTCEGSANCKFLNSFNKQLCLTTLVYQGGQVLTFEIKMLMLFSSAKYS